MIKCIHRDAMLEMLLNTVETERHVRGALLLEVIDELYAKYADGPATRAARVLLERVERRDITDTEFIACVGELRTYVLRGPFTPTNEVLPSYVSSRPPAFAQPLHQGPTTH